MKQAPAIFGVLFMEMKNVKIHVKSFEKSGGEQSAIETVSFGKMAEKNGKFYVFYLRRNGRRWHEGNQNYH